jgi:hypothetical protein
MSVNGIDVAGPVSTICGGIWLICNTGLVAFVFRFRPKNIQQRRWKASLLVGGLPVLGFPLLVPALLLIITFFSIDVSKFKFSTLVQNLPLLTTGFVSLIMCTVPFSAFMAVVATIGSYTRFMGSDKWLNTVVPPVADERHKTHEPL